MKQLQPCPIKFRKLTVSIQVHIIEVLENSDMYFEIEQYARVHFQLL